MNSKIKIHLPSLMFAFIIFDLFWALWKEYSISETLYMYGVFFVFVYAFLALGKGDWNVTLMQEIGFLTLWCLFMFLVYNFSQYSEFLKRVSFFGINVDSHARIMLYMFLLVVPGIVITEVLKFKNELIFRIIVFAILITSLIFSIRAVIVFPDAIRARSTAEYLGHESILFATPSYSIVYAFSIIAPWFLARFSETKGSSKLYYFLMFVSICIIVTISQFATALLALVLGVAVYWFLSGERAEDSALRVFAIFCMIFVLLIRAPLVGVLNSLSEIVSGAWASKLLDIASFLDGSGTVGDIATRAGLYTDSAQAFIASPFWGMLFGAETGIIGGHSTMLDMLALIGVLGTLFFVGAVYSSYKRAKAKAKNKKYIAVVIAITVSYVFLACTKNIITALAINYAFFVILPMLLGMKESSENE